MPRLQQFLKSLPSCLITKISLLNDVRIKLYIERGSPPDMPFGALGKGLGRGASYKLIFQGFFFLFFFADPSFNSCPLLLNMTFFATLRVTPRLGIKANPPRKSLSEVLSNIYRDETGCYCYLAYNYSSYFELLPLEGKKL